MTTIEMDTQSARFWSSKLSEYIVALYDESFAIDNDKATVANNFQSISSSTFQDEITELINEMRDKLVDLQNIKSGLDSAISAHEEADKLFGQAP